MERLTENGAFKERINGNIPYAEIISFVSQVEDFMEEIKIKDLTELKRIITTNVVWQENQTLKDKWQKLKELVSNELTIDITRRDTKGISEFAREMYDNFACVEEWVLGKMQELENVSNTNVGEIGNDNNVATKEAIKVTKALKREKNNE